MESEKVKEIKSVLESFAIDDKEMTLIQSPVPQNQSCMKTIKYADILTLINELESENEMLLGQRNKTYNIWVKDTEELKDRIAFLENDNELLRNAKVVYENVDYCYEDLKKAQDRIAELEKENITKTYTITDLLNKQEFYEKEKLKQFAERLKKKFDHSVSGIIYRTDSIDKKIDETLKEFIK